MALASARRTIEANQVLTLLLSTHLYATCQALDLRVLDKLFRFRLAKTVSTAAETHLKEHLSDSDLKEACVAAKDHIMRRLDQTTSADSVPRITVSFALVLLDNADWNNRTPSTMLHLFSSPSSAKARATLYRRSTHGRQNVPSKLSRPTTIFEKSCSLAS